MLERQRARSSASSGSRSAPAAGRVVREQDVAGAPVLDEVGARFDAGSSREGRGDERERGREAEQPELHWRKGYRRPRAHRGRRAPLRSRAAETRPGARSAGPPRASRGLSPAGGRPDLALQPRCLRPRPRSASRRRSSPEGVDDRARSGDERARRPARERARDVGRARALGADPRAGAGSHCGRSRRASPTARGCVAPTTAPTLESPRSPTRSSPHSATSRATCCQSGRPSESARSWMSARPRSRS